MSIPIELSKGTKTTKEIAEELAEITSKPVEKWVIRRPMVEITDGNSGKGCHR